MDAAEAAGKIALHLGTASGGRYFEITHIVLLRSTAIN
jgi:hypothetical protein